MLGKLSDYKASCSVCLFRFSKKNLEKAIKFSIDRNLKKLINEDIKIECRYSNFAGCKEKQGSFEKILGSHEKTCKACTKCKYMCPINNEVTGLTCDCG